MAKCYHINTTRWSNTCYVRTSKISSGRLFLVAASPYASKYGGLRINSTNPAHKKHIASRKCKTCIPPENLSLHVLSRKQNGKATIDGMAERVWITGKCMCSYLAPELSSGFQTNCKREISSNHTLCRVSWTQKFRWRTETIANAGSPQGTTISIAGKSLGWNETKWLRAVTSVWLYILYVYICLRQKQRDIANYENVIQLEVRFIDPVSWRMPRPRDQHAVYLFAHWWKTCLWD